MKRKLYNRLKEWKADVYRKPLIINGARQVGKTWLMRNFGENEYEKCIYINCDNNPLIENLFNDYDIQRILLAIQSLTNIVPEPGNTLIILDEIQEVRHGLSVLKYFCENAPEYHVMVAGSLLGITLHQGESFPVGKVDMMTLYPLDFEEFLMAIGEENLAKAIATGDMPLISILGKKLEHLLRQYYFVGGMPGVVNMFVDTNDLSRVRETQQQIITAYKNDISKHAPKEQVMRIGMVLDSIPSQLAKENKKFIYNVLKKGARAREFELAIQWLVDSGIVYKVSRVRNIQMPLKFYEDISAFKLFVLDCGLLTCMSKAPASQILIGDNAFKEFKGAFSEQYVLQQLKCNPDNDIYYWSSESADSELDFLMQNNDQIVPIEVKAEDNLRSRSMSSILSTHPDLNGIRLSMAPYREQNRIKNIPLYAVNGLYKFIIGFISLLLSFH